MQVVKVNSRSLMNFSVRILQTSVKLVHVEIFELITCSVRGTGMLGKRALTPNKTNVQEECYITQCDSCFEVVLYFLLLLHHQLLLPLDISNRNQKSLYGVMTNRLQLGSTSLTISNGLLPFYEMSKQR